MGGKRERLVTAKEAQRIMRVSDHVLQELVRKEKLVPFRTPGGHRRYRLSEIMAYLTSSRRGP